MQDEHGPLLGQPAGSGDERDAIHVAAMPVRAGTALSPGDRVQLVEDSAVKGPDPIGIVDPFLDKTVAKGEWFWLILFPRTISSLRHDWTHPKVPGMIRIEPEKQDTSEAEEWLEDFASRCLHMSLEDLVEGARESSIGLPMDLYVTDEEVRLMWRHLETAYGLTPEGDPYIFHCSC